MKNTLGRLTAVVALTSLGMTACSRAPSEAGQAAPVPLLKSANPVRRITPPHDPRAVAALLINLTDDEFPVPRWNDPGLPLVCGLGTRGWVDDAPLVPGELMPMASFKLELILDSACPMSPDGPRLSGRLSMVVVRDDELGLVPLVRPHDVE